jgi:predicted nucleic-acid-binding protein
VAALDTNILVRWLVNDDAAQCAEVSSLLAATAANGERLFVTVTVMLELEWVLRSRYGFNPSVVTAALDALLSTTELEFQDEPVLEQAVWFFKQAGSADFADCLHVALTAKEGHGPFLTFDRRAANVAGAVLLDTAS